MSAKKSKFVPVAQVRPDAKGRVTLSKLAEGISSFNVSRDNDGRLLLEPMVEIPAKEKWLYENGEVLASVRRGLMDSKNRRVQSLGSFAKFIKEDEES